MNILDLLKGKKIVVKTDVGVNVELQIEKVEKKHHSQELEPATASNDWWPASREWDTYNVFFTNGYKKTYSSIEEIQIVE